MAEVKIQRLTAEEEAKFAEQDAAQEQINQEYADELASLLGKPTAQVIEIRTLTIGESVIEVPIARLSFKERELVNSKRFRKSDGQSQPTLDLECQDTNQSAYTLSKCVMKVVGNHPNGEPKYAPRFTLEDLLGTPEVKDFAGRVVREAKLGLLDDTKPETEETLYALLSACHAVNEMINPLFLAAMAHALA